MSKRSALLEHGADACVLANQMSKRQYEQMEPSDLYPEHLFEGTWEYERRGSKDGAQILKNRRQLFEKWDVVAVDESLLGNSWIRTKLPQHLLDHLECFITSDGGVLVTSSPYTEKGHAPPGFEWVPTIYSNCLDASTLVCKREPVVREEPLVTIDTVRYVKYNQDKHHAVFQALLRKNGNGISAVYTFSYMAMQRNTLVVVDGGMVIGIVMYNDSGTRIVQMEVLEPYRRKGYGRTIFGDFEALAHLQGFLPALCLPFLPCGFERFGTFLESLGWDIIGLEHGETLLWGKHMTQRQDRAKLLTAVLTTEDPEETDVDIFPSPKADLSWVALGEDLREFKERMSFINFGFCCKYGGVHLCAVHADAAYTALLSIISQLDDIACGKPAEVFGGVDCNDVFLRYSRVTKEGVPEWGKAHPDFDAASRRTGGWNGTKHVYGNVAVMTQVDKAFIIETITEARALLARFRPLISYIPRGRRTCKDFEQALDGLHSICVE